MTLNLKVKAMQQKLVLWASETYQMIFQSFPAFFKFDLELDPMTLTLTFQGHKVKDQRSIVNNVPVIL